MLYSDVLRERYRELVNEKAMRDRGEDPRTVLKTGLRDFDRLAGIDRSILTVVGAPTGEGKSIFKKHTQEYAAKCGLKALDLSFEDPPSASADRTFSTETGINNRVLRKGLYGDKELSQVAMALDDAEEWAVNIEYHYGLKSVEESLEIIRASDADLVSLDYAQAFPEGEKGLERTIAQLAWDLAVDAQEKKRAIVIYSQLKQSVEERGVQRAENSRRWAKDSGAAVDVEGFRPFGVGDLAWSGALGQRAKGLGFLFRPDRYLKRYGVNAADDRMELIWPKMNFGSEGKVVVGFSGKTASLYDLPEK